LLARRRASSSVVDFVVLLADVVLLLMLKKFVFSIIYAGCALHLLGAQAFGEGAFEAQPMLLEAEADLAEIEAQAIYGRTFNRVNFSKQVLPELEEPRSLAAYLSSHPRAIITKIRDNQNASNLTLLNWHQRAPAHSKSDYQMRLAAQQFDVDYSSQTTPGELQQYLADETTKVLSNMVLAQLTFIDAFNNGMNFNLDLGSLWSGTAKKNTAATGGDPGTVRYGLVLQGIEHSENPIAIAALTDMESSLQFATRSRPIWTIEERGVDRRHAQPFNVLAPVSGHYLDIKAAQQEKLDTHDETYLMHNLSNTSRFLWSKMSLPEAKFSGNIRPRRNTDLNDLSGESSALPGVQLQLNQSEGLYSMSYLMSNSLKKEGISHQVTLPVHGTMTMKRIYNEDFQEQETIAENILMDSKLPSVTIRQLHSNNSYRAGVHFSRNRHTIILAAESPENWKPSAKIFTTAGETYRLDYSFYF